MGFLAVAILSLYCTPLFLILTHRGMTRYIVPPNTLCLKRTKHDRYCEENLEG